MTADEAREHIAYNQRMSAALGLLRLQQVDGRIDLLESELGRIRSELENNAVAATARRAMEAAEAEQREAEAGRMDAEQRARSQRSKLQQAEAALYGGSVRNPKELQDLQADVVSLRKHLATLDQAEVAWMERLDVAEKRSLFASQELDRVTGALRAEHAKLADRQIEILKHKEDFQAERQAAAEAISARWLEVYDELRRSKRGVAVAEISDGACAACGTGLTAALQQSARHAAELVLCPSCGRILYGD